MSPIDEFKLSFREAGHSCLRAFRRSAGYREADEGMMMCLYFLVILAAAVINTVDNMSYGVEQKLLRYAYSLVDGMPYIQSLLPIMKASAQKAVSDDVRLRIGWITYRAKYRKTEPDNIVKGTIVNASIVCGGGI